MKKVLTHIIFFSLKIISFFPLWYLFLWSGILYFIIYYLLGYRRKVVRTNLTNSFPQKNPAQLLKIEKEYYRHLCDLVFESIWCLSASRKQMKKRCAMVNIHLVEHYYKKQQDMVFLLGHVGNWEWASLAFTAYDVHQLLPLYKPVKNKTANEIFLKLRSRFGARLIPMMQIGREINTTFETPVGFAFIADQSPMPEHAHWTNFLNQETCFFNGYDKIARKKGYPVFFCHVNKIKRGYYEVKFEELTSDASTLKQDETTEMYARHLESNILEAPAFWVWSHRRWKHKKKNKHI